MHPADVTDMFVEPLLIELYIDPEQMRYRLTLPGRPFRPTYLRGWLTKFLVRR
jgi:hypothetical protein